ncbi:MAG: OmpA family protein [Pseudomonadota bacterium]
MRFAVGTGVCAATLALTLSVPALSQTSQSDQEILEKQRQLLLERRKATSPTRTLLEIDPSTGATEEPANAPSAGTIVSPDATATAPSGSGAAGSSRADTAVAAVPLDLAEEDQLFRPINFAYDSAFLDQPARQILDGICSTLQSDLSLNPGSSYFVIGHTDAAGPETYNLSLSQRRADATKQYLVSSCGISVAQLEAVGLGEERLLANASPRAAKQRRVEIQVQLGDEGG